jgi:hypothetical protein
MTEWKIQGSRVYGNGQSYNCPNKVTAQQLHNTLTTYHQATTLNKNIETKYDQITKQLIQIEMSMKILESEIKTLTELVKQ